MCETGSFFFLGVAGDPLCSVALRPPSLRFGWTRFVVSSFGDFLEVQFGSVGRGARVGCEERICVFLLMCSRQSWSPFPRPFDIMGGRGCDPCCGVELRPE